jgi:hypothetical protein
MRNFGVKCATCDNRRAGGDWSKPQGYTFKD